MFIHISPDEGLIPHHSNIIALHKSNTLTQKLDTLNPLYAGGYAMALLLGPRTDGCLGREYYGDYDLYARDEEHLAEIIAGLQSIFTNTLLKKIETDMALSLEVVHEGIKERIQIIKLTTGDAETVLNRFDFINCAVVYDPTTRIISMHKDTLSQHLDDTLEILNPWMLHQMTADTTDNVIIQLIRFKKYCWRWEYTLGTKAFDLLMSIYMQYPDITIKKAFRYGSGSGDLPVFGRKDQNVWEAMACIFKQYPGWSDDLDTIGHINRGSSEFFNANLVNNGAIDNLINELPTPVEESDGDIFVLENLIDGFLIGVDDNESHTVTIPRTNVVVRRPIYEMGNPNPVGFANVSALREFGEPGYLQGDIPNTSEMFNGFDEHIGRMNTPRSRAEIRAQAQAMGREIRIATDYRPHYGTYFSNRVFRDIDIESDRIVNLMIVEEFDDGTRNYVQTSTPYSTVEQAVVLLQGEGVQMNRMSVIALDGNRVGLSYMIYGMSIIRNLISVLGLPAHESM